MPVETLLNVYIDANIMLLVAYFLWSLASFSLAKMGLKRAYTLQLRLLNGGMVAIALSPVFVQLLGGLASPYATNISDIVVAQYLAGNVEISAVRLQSILEMRADAVRSFAMQGTIISKVVLGVFLLGFGWFSARVFRNIHELRSILRASHNWRQFGRLHLLVSDTVLVPFSTRGLRNRYIVIPSVMLDDTSDLRMAVSHELEHFRRYDVEWEIALEFLRPLFFWNPVFYGWKRQVTQLREFSCDQILASRKSFDLRAYCECLLRASARSLQGKTMVVASPTVPLVNSESAGSSVLRSRIVALTTPEEIRSSRGLFVLLIAPLMLLVFLSAMMIQRSTDWSHDRLMLSTIVNLERLDARSTLASP